MGGMQIRVGGGRVGCHHQASAELPQPLNAFHATFWRRGRLPLQVPQHQDPSPSTRSSFIRRGACLSRACSNPSMKTPERHAIASGCRCPANVAHITAKRQGALNQPARCSTGALGISHDPFIPDVLLVFPARPRSSDKAHPGLIGEYACHRAGDARVGCEQPEGATRDRPLRHSGNRRAREKFHGQTRLVKCQPPDPSTPPSGVASSSSGWVDPARRQGSAEVGAGDCARGRDPCRWTEGSRQHGQNSGSKRIFFGSGTRHRCRTRCTALPQRGSRSHPPRMRDCEPRRSRASAVKTFSGAGAGGLAIAAPDHGPLH